METQLLWGVAVWRLIIAVLLLLLGAVSEPLLRRLAARIWGPPAKPPGGLPAARLWVRPLYFVVLAGLLVAAGAVLQLPADTGILVGNVLQVALVAALVFFVMRLIGLARHASRTLESKDERALIRLFAVIQVMVLMIAGIFVTDAAVYPLADHVGRVLDTEILWGISVLRSLIGVVLLLLGLWSRPVVRWILRRALGSQRLAAGAGWVRDVQELIPYPLSLITHAVLWYFVGQMLLLPTEPFNVRLWVTTALMVALVLAVTFLAWRCLDVVSRAVSRKALHTQSRLDDQLIPLARKAIKVAMAAVVAIIIVEKMGFSTTSLIASLSVGGLALALAAKDTIANLFGSVVVFADQPFQVGDGIKVGSVEGVVEEVGLRSTRIRGLDRTMATVPNQQFTSAAVVNLSDRPNRRISFEVGIGYDASASDMEAFLRAVRSWLSNKVGINRDSVAVHLTQFADSSLTVQVQVLTEAADLATARVIQEELLLGIMRLVESHRLELAFPTRTVHIAPPSGNASVRDKEAH